MLIGLGEHEAELCSQILRRMTVLRVGHTTAATERMLVTRPLVVVCTSELERAEIDKLRERAQDVGATVVAIASGISQAELAPRLFAALAEAELAR